MSEITQQWLDLDLQIMAGAPACGPAETWQAEYRRELAALSEGLCPARHGRLEPVPCPAGRILGHCQRCRKYWGLNLDTLDLGWWLDYNPVTRVPAFTVAEFMKWEDP